MVSSLISIVRAGKGSKLLNTTVLHNIFQFHITYKVQGRYPIKWKFLRSLYFQVYDKITHISQGTTNLDGVGKASLISA